MPAVLPKNHSREIVLEVDDGSKIALTNPCYKCAGSGEYKYGGGNYTTLCPNCEGKGHVVNKNGESIARLLGFQFS